MKDFTVILHQCSQDETWTDYQFNLNEQIKQELADESLRNTKCVVQSPKGKAALIPFNNFLYEFWEGSLKEKRNFIVLFQNGKKLRFRRT